MVIRLFSVIFITTVLVGVKVNCNKPEVEEEIKKVTIHKLGELSGTMQPTPKVQELITSIKPQVEAKLGRNVRELTLLSYREQVVGGYNYFAKVNIGEEQVAHLRVFQGLDGTVRLDAVQYPKGRDDAIGYF